MAGIPLLSGFNITSDSPADTRLVLTKDEMKAMKDSSMPQTYFCTDSESGDIYVYNKANEVDENTGKFRLFQSGGGDEFTGTKAEWEALTTEEKAEYDGKKVNITDLNGTNYKMEYDVTTKTLYINIV